MIDYRAVRRYSRALFGLAEKQGELEAIDAQLLATRALLERSREISHLVMNSTIAFAEKEDFIGKIISGSPLLVNFLKVLIKKKRFGLVAKIQEDFHLLLEKRQGIRQVEAVTAEGLSAENTEKLKTVLKKKLRSEIRLTVTTDPGLIGGLVLRFEGLEINGSYKQRLEELRQALLG